MDIEFLFDLELIFGAVCAGKKHCRIFLRVKWDRMVGIVEKKATNIGNCGKYRKLLFFSFNVFLTRECVHRGLHGLADHVLTSAVRSFLIKAVGPVNIQVGLMCCVLFMRVFGLGLIRLDS